MVAKSSPRKKATRKRKPKLKAVVSVPHSGTHAVLADIAGARNAGANPQGARPDTPLIKGHIWGRDAKSGPMYADDWLPLLKGREVYMPVRDPAQMAWAYPNVHGQPLSHLRASLKAACDLIGKTKVKLVDIRKLEPENVKGPGDRDEAAGAELIEEFPEYFGDYYGR